jgi:RecB family endonuclease NucS
MRIVIASCSVIYTGRGDTKLNRAVRALMLKADGSISIHNNKSNKPLNYMGKGNVFTEEVVGGQTIWNFDTRKENLRVEMHEIISDTSFDLEDDEEGLIRDGTENHLQAWLADNPDALGAGYTLVSREYVTGAGPVDLLVLDADGNPIAIEVKRVAMLSSADQIRRYVEALKEKEGFENVRGIIAALDVRPNTVKLAEKRGTDWVIVPPSWRDINPEPDMNTTEE